MQAIKQLNSNNRRRPINTLAQYDELEKELDKAKEITRSLREALIISNMKSNYSLPGF
jgi:hypothetical protein